MESSDTTGSNNAPATAIFACPGRYIQGPGLISTAPEHLARLKIQKVALLCSARSQRNEGGRLVNSLENAGIEVVVATFGGECSRREIDSQVEFLTAQNKKVEALIALGGGKPIDTGKSIAYRLGVPVIVMPTLASNDSPCAALSVIYTPEGETESFEVFERSPDLVIVDTEIIAAAPVRTLVAGMGDSMATCYEARTCRQNPQGITPLGVRPTMAATALSELCATVLFEHGVAALAAAEAGRTDHSLESVIESNTLLSGLGFESGGLAGAHAVAQALTLLHDVDSNYMHGEMVAFGVLSHLMLESDEAEASRVAEFFAQVGLPVSLSQLGLSADADEALNVVVEATLQFPFIGNLSQPATAETVRAALLAADRLGQQVCEKVGDAAYRKLHAAA